MQPRTRRTRSAVCLLSIAGCISVAQAQSLTYGIDTGVGETDNVTLAHADRISQTIAVTDFDIDYDKKSQRLDVDAKGKFSYLDYLQNAYGNQFIGRFDGVGDLALIPQRLTWALQEDYGQAAINPFTPTTPTNLENINYVSTGPDLYLRLGGSSFVDLNARVARAQFQSSPFSNDRGTGSIAWGVKLSPLSSISIHGDYERVLFDNTALNSDFERSNVFFRYEIEGVRTDLSADIGATDVGEANGSNRGPLAKFKLGRRVSPSARLTLTLGHVYTDGTTAFSGLQGGLVGLVGSAPATNTSQNYTSSYGSLGWDYQRNRTTLGLSGRWERDSYPGQPALDRTMTTANIEGRRLLTRAFSLQVTAAFYKSDYSAANVITANESANTATSSVVAALTWRHGRALEVKIACEHTTYTTSPNDTGYRDNRVFLTLGYRPFRDLTVGEAIPGS